MAKMKEKTMKIKKVVEKWKICNKEEEVASLEEKTMKLVLKQLYKWIKIFRKKVRGY